MTTISKAQALQRWDTLPDNIREALCSETNSDFIWKTCKDEHVPDEKIYAIIRVAGYVLMGFVHPDDTSKEMQDATGIDARITDQIASAINTRIFAPLRKTIDNTYEPAVKLWFASKIASGAAEPAMIIKEIPQSPATTPSVAQKSAPATTNKNPEAQTPQPFILQENPSAGLNKKTSDFHIEISDDKLKGLSNAQRFAPIKLAVLELGENQEKSPSMPKPASTDARYEGEFGSFSSLPKMSKEKTGGLTPPLPGKDRTVTEIISSVPAPTKSSNEQIVPKPLSGTPNPLTAPRPLQDLGGQVGQVIPKPIVASIPAPIQVPIKEFPEQIKTAPLSAQPVKIPQPAPVKNYGGTMPPKPAVIQKNYSEAETPQKFPTPPQTPTFKVPQENSRPSQSFGGQAESKIPSPVQLPINQIKIVPLPPASPVKISQPSLSTKAPVNNPILPNLLQKNSNQQALPTKPIIRKDYSEDDLIPSKTSTIPAPPPKIQTPPQAPTSRIPVPPQKK